MFHIIKYAGEIIKRARRENGISQHELIREIGEYKVSLRTLRRLEKGNQRVKKE